MDRFAIGIAVRWLKPAYSSPASTSYTSANTAQTPSDAPTTGEYHVTYEAVEVSA